MAGQGNPSNALLDSDNNQIENLGPTKNSTSGDRDSGYFSTSAKIGLGSSPGSRPKLGLGRTFE